MSGYAVKECGKHLGVIEAHILIGLIDDEFISMVGEDADLRKATYGESEDWYSGITADMFS